MDEQKPDPVLPPQSGLGPRRGKQLQVQTSLGRAPPPQSFDEMLPCVARPVPVEAGPYRTSTEICDPTSALPSSALPTARRTSRLAFKGMFTKGKGVRGDKYDEALDTAVVIEECDGTLSEQLNEPDRAEREPAQEPPKDRAKRGSKIKPIKRTPKLGSVWEPPSLFQAYPKAVKEGNLFAPVMDVEAVLRIDKYRKMSEGGQDTSALIAEAQELGIDEENLKDKKRHKKRSSSVTNVECVPKLYILTIDGHLLQYAAEGPVERPPERIMHLCKESAAFASDAIPGKHWVLQISQTSTEDGNVVPDPRRPSMFHKFTFGSDVKKPVSHFLLVMNSAEEMNTWLVTIRKEIQSLGGKVYRPDEKAIKSPTDTAPLLRERPSPLLLPNEDPHSREDGVVGQARLLKHRASVQGIVSPPNSGLPPLSLATRPSLNHGSTRGSNGLLRASVAIFSPTSRQAPDMAMAPMMLRSSSSSPRAATFNLDKALPERPVDDTQARIDALGIINAEKIASSHIALTNNVLSEDGRLSPKSSAASPQSAKFPVSAYNPEAAKSSLESELGRVESRTSQHGSFDKVFPNFSAPTVSRRFSHARTMSASTHRTSGSGSAALGHTPELTDAESLPQDSVAGDIPVLQPSNVALEVAPTVGVVTVAAPASPHKPLPIDLQRLPSGNNMKYVEDPAATSRKSSEESEELKPRPRDRSMPPPTGRPNSRARATSASPHPKRLSSLSYANGPVPNSVQYLLPPPHPPPTTALPALPPGIAPQMRPSSAQDDSRRSASPMITPVKALRRPASMLVTSPTSSGPSVSTSLNETLDATSTLPVAPPPLAIKERRRLSERPLIVDNPPSAPPPTTPQPLPPNSSTLPSKPASRTQSPQPVASHLRRLSGKEASPSIAAIKIAGYSDLDLSQRSPVLLSPMSETWNKYLQRIGAS